MVTIESAYYYEDLWCAYELKDSNGKYDEDLRLKMRKESQLNQFTCPDCGEHLILCAGPILEPYFKHHESSKCVIRTIEGGIKYNLGRRLLFQLARRSFPDASISCNTKISDKYRAGILVDNGSSKLSIEYLCNDMKLADWEEKHSFYQDNCIIDVWILNYGKYKVEHFQTFEYLISEKASPVIKLLHTDNESIIFKRNVLIEEANEKLLAVLEYNLADLCLMTDGELDCDFNIICEANIAIVNERYRSERALLEEQERINKEEQKRIEQEERERWQKDKEIRRQAALDSFQRKNNVETVHSVLDKFRIKREKLCDHLDMSNKMKMNGIGEAWGLPVLNGTERQVRNANALRFTYLREKDKELAQLSGDLREKMCNETVEYLERKFKATDWIYGR